MTDTNNSTVDADSVPDILSSGSTVLVACAGDPTELEVCLSILCTRGTPDDVAFVLTTTESADQTIAKYGRIRPRSARPSLGIVDTASRQQSLSALHEETPVIFTPSPGDLERVVIGLSELAENIASPGGNRHLVVRSLTPILAAAPTDRVETVLERITGLRSETGLCVFGLDYTAHSETTLQTVADHVDGILWVSQTPPNGFDFEYQSVRSRGRSSLRMPSGE